MASCTANPCGEVIMWKRPWLASLVLVCGTYVYHACVVRNRSVVALICNALLVIFLAVGSLGIFLRNRYERIPIDLSKLEVSSEAATSIVACFANTVGATEGVLRVAASGSDYKLFCKVVLVLYASAAVGRAATGGTIAYLALWIIFTLPICFSKLAVLREGSATPQTLAKPANRIR